MCAAPQQSPFVSRAWSVVYMWARECARPFLNCVSCLGIGIPSVWFWCWRVRLWLRESGKKPIASILLLMFFTVIQYNLYSNLKYQCFLYRIFCLTILNLLTIGYWYTAQLVINNDSLSISLNSNPYLFILIGLRKSHTIWNCLDNVSSTQRTDAKCDQTRSL